MKACTQGSFYGRGRKHRLHDVEKIEIGQVSVYNGNSNTCDLDAKGENEMERKEKKHPILMILAVGLVLIAAAVFAYFALRAKSTPKVPICADNTKNFGVFLSDLVRAYETPTEEDRRIIEADLETIRAVSENEYEIASVIADRWQTVYLDPDYRLFLYEKDDPAGLAAYGVENSADQAIVILGYQLADGEMEPELVHRCDAAAELSRAFPEAVLVCSGGATGKNNPHKHTEAGLMKAYLTEKCGIDAARIYTDEKALTTVDNAIFTFEILEKQGIRNMTIVTSSYHQRRSQMLYSLLAELYRQQHGYCAALVGNYNYEIDGAARYALDDRIAIQGMAGILDLPKEVVRSMPPLNISGTSAGNREDPAYGDAA